MAGGVLARPHLDAHDLRLVRGGVLPGHAAHPLGDPLAGGRREPEGASLHAVAASLVRRLHGLLHLLLGPLRAIRARRLRLEARPLPCLPRVHRGELHDLSHRDPVEHRLGHLEGTAAPPPPLPGPRHPPGHGARRLRVALGAHDRPVDEALRLPDAGGHGQHGAQDLHVLLVRLPLQDVVRRREGREAAKILQVLGYLHLRLGHQRPRHRHPGRQAGALRPVQGGHDGGHWGKVFGAGAADPALLRAAEPDRRLEHVPVVGVGPLRRARERRLPRDGQPRQPLSSRAAHVWINQ
mmetsp:Transcript_1071/g.3024  ORF Transcript_1071/g.3024 Transcript_1071/m.3024 type:complete len:295 (-) Transcript_1071:1-885(-)